MWHQLTLSSLIIFLTVQHICVPEKITYINVEHPRVIYYHPDYAAYVNLTTTRYGRSNPVYYVGFHIELIKTLDKNFLVDIYFLELLTNRYKPSFIEFHHNLCDFLERDKFFGVVLRKAVALKKSCPVPPGTYHGYNMTVNPAIIPKGFPFSKGRIVANFTNAKTKAIIFNGYIDMTISQIDKKKAQL